MLSLIAIIGNAHATPCDDYAPSPYDAKACDPKTPGTTICGTNNTGGFHMECQLQGAHNGTAAQITAVYRVDDDYYIYGVNGDGDQFCCDNDTAATSVYGAWDGVDSTWLGTDDATLGDTIDLTAWTGDTLVYADNDPAIYSGGAADTVIGVDESGSTDEIHGGDGADQIKGLGGSDTIYGDAGADQICGGAGGDWINGGPQGDVIFGGPGSDVMLGGNTEPPTNRCEALAGNTTVTNCTGTPSVTSCPF